METVGTDFHEVLQSAVIYILLPIAAIAGILAAKNGKGTTVFGIVAGTLLALGFTFGNASTWKGVGTAVADGISAALKWTV